MILGARTLAPHHTVLVASRYGERLVEMPVDTRIEPSLSRPRLVRAVGRVGHVPSLLAHGHKVGAWVWAVLQLPAARLRARAAMVPERDR